MSMMNLVREARGASQPSRGVQASFAARVTSNSVPSTTSFLATRTRPCRGGGLEQTVRRFKALLGRRDRPALASSRASTVALPIVSFLGSG